MEREINFRKIILFIHCVLFIRTRYLIDVLLLRSTM